MTKRTVVVLLSPWVVAIAAAFLLLPAFAQEGKGSSPAPAPAEGPTPSTGAPAPASKTFIRTLPGIETQLMSAEEREKVLKLVNEQRCTCGCKDDSLAWCLNHDPACPFAPKLVKLACASISPNFKKSIAEADFENWQKYINPPPALKLQFDYLNGFELDKLSARQKDMVIKRAHAVACPCGCKHETVAKCNNVDPTCQQAPAEIRKIMDEVLASVPPEPMPVPPVEHVK
ncbi:MAG: hypothetical protein U0166_19505 [Acidobacteriota bacterium]